MVEAKGISLLYLDICIHGYILKLFPKKYRNDKSRVFKVCNSRETGRNTPIIVERCLFFLLRCKTKRSSNIKDGERVDISRENLGVI
jgi:hypothetical protein